MNIPSLTEDVVLDKIAKIRHADVARKVDIVQFFSLQLEATPELTPVGIDAITTLIPTLLASNSHLLYTSTTSLLTTYLPLLAPHTDKLRTATQSILPPLLDKLTDAKERTYKPAEDALVLFGNQLFAHPSAAAAGNLSSSARGKEKESPAAVWERLVVGVMEGKHARGKVGAMRVLVRVREGRGVGLKHWLPVLAALLEDSDGAVRDEAKITLVQLLSPEDVPPSAHAELRKMMQSRGMKPALVEGIMGSLVAPEEAVPAVGGEQQGSGEVVKVAIVTERELEHEFATLVQPFVGKETEHNWQAREAAVVRVRGMVRAGVYAKFGAAFVSALRHEFWGESVKAMISLRTTLATATCALYIDTATALGDAFDPLMDTLLPHLLKLSGSTKKLVAEASQQVTAAIIDHAACHPRVFVLFLEQGLGERTVQSRGHFMAHVARYIAVQAKRPGGKHAVEGTTLLNSSQSTALALLADLIRRGLTDPNPGVKESARAAFVVFYREWPRQGAVLLGGLEEGVRKQVDKALASAAAVDGPATARLSSTEQKETSPPPTAPKAPAPTAARRAPAARKPSSAIAAAIRKAKEEQRAARLAEAEAQAMSANDGGGEEAAVEQQQEVPAKQQAEGESRENDANETHASNNGEVREVVETPNPVNSRTESPIKSPATPTSPAAPKTPVKPVSLLDFQTPDGSSDTFKVMTPAPARVSQPDLVETTETSLSESDQTIPLDEPPTITVADSEVISSPAQDEALPEAPKPRRPRASVNPVAGMEKPQPLYTKLRTLVDCSYWLDRQQDYQEDCVDELPDLLLRSSSPVTLSDISGFIAWSSRHAQSQLLDELDDDLLRERVQAALQEGELMEDDRNKDVLQLVDLVQETLTTHQNEDVMKACLFLMWDMVIRQTRLWIGKEDALIRSCLALRRSDSSSIRRGSAGLLALVIATTPDRMNVLHSIIICANQALERADGALRSRLEVFALINIAGIACNLPRSIVEDQVPGIKPLLLQAINSRFIPSREAAYTTLVALQSSIDNSKVLLTELLPELTEAQRNMAMYVIKRDLEGAIGGLSAGGGDGLVREIQRLSTRL